MKRVLWVVLIVAAAAAVVAVQPKRSRGGAAPAPVAPELTSYDQAKSSPGFTLVPRDGLAEVHLLDPLGHVVHRWKTDATRARLLPNGHLLVVHGSKWGAQQPYWKKMRRYVHEYDWDGNQVWEYAAEDVAHHDVHRLANGNTLFLRRVMVPAELRAAKVSDPVLAKQEIRSDAIVEVTPAGEVVWEWMTHHYLDLNSCGTKSCKFNKTPKALANYRDWSHLNTAVEIPENPWYAQGYGAFKPGNIMAVARNWWLLFIIDKETKEIVWRYPGGDYKGGVSGIHEGQVIPPGLPGAGEVLVFDNGRPTHTGMSFVIQFNPITFNPTWIYDAGRTFSSLARGSEQRLPNGNTLISEDNHGRCFEVTPQNEIVWQWKGKEKTGINRCYRYPLDYAPQLQTLR